MSQQKTQPLTAIAGGMVGAKLAWQIDADGKHFSIAVAALQGLNTILAEIKEYQSGFSVSSMAQAATLTGLSTRADLTVPEKWKYFHFCMVTP